MKMLKWFAAAFFAVTVGLAFGEDRPDAGAADGLANQLVTEVARVKDGDVVLIYGEARDAELLEGLSVEVARVGGDQVVVLVPSSKTLGRLIADVPAKFDERTSPAALHMADIATVVFHMESMDVAAMMNVAPARMPARLAAELRIYEKHIARNVRWVNIGNGLYPSDWRAKELGITTAELSAIFQAGLAVDYPALQKTAAATKARLAGREITITSPGGTKLTVGVEPDAAFANDGVISDDKVKAGGAAVMVWLPAGEAYTRVKPGTATGKVVVPQLVFEGESVADLTLTFERGKLTDLSAKPGKGFDRLRAQYEASPEGREMLSIIDVGLNPGVKFPEASRDASVSAEGVVTLFIGGDLWAGGTNKSTFVLPACLRDATLAVDGDVLVAAGELAK